MKRAPITLHDVYYTYVCTYVYLIFEKLASKFIDRILFSNDVHVQNLNDVRCMFKKINRNS